MPVALLLHPVLEDHGDAENQDEVDANNAKRGGEDLIEVLVGKGGKGANAPTLLGCNEGVGTGAVLDKGRRGSIVVSAAIELVRLVVRGSERTSSYLGVYLLL